jgi:glycosyltransferase involved in cell wall biosynthesis
MSKKDLFLSVCIPTYNRCEVLKDSLHRQLFFFEKFNIELCISNNASTDDTDVYIKNLLKLHKNIKYHLQTDNKGIDQNMIDVISMAKGKYILPLGDDNILLHEHWKILTEELNRNPDLLVLNGYHGLKSHLPQKLSGISFNNPSEAFEKIWDKLEFGSFIIKKDTLIHKIYKKYMGTNHAYSGWVWESLLAKYKKNGSVLISTAKTPLILFKKERKTWHDDMFKIFFYDLPSWLQIASKSYPIVLERGLLQKYFKKFTKTSTLIDFKNGGFLTKENIRLYMSLFNDKQKAKAYRVAKWPKILDRLFSLALILKSLKHEKA